MFYFFHLSFQKDKLQRQINYAKSINERNREEYELERVRPRPQTYTKEEVEGEEESDVIDKRRLVTIATTFVNIVQ